MTNPTHIRNIAIIAHVDHGKTTLVDGLLKQSNTFRDNSAEMAQHLIMDSGDQERERGITITAKTTAVSYGDYKINIIDTPGHADFSGEVERTLQMADGVLLVVDAAEGPMPQTKFVLSKALQLGLKPIVVINKIDKPARRIEAVENEISDLFLELATDDSQLDYPIYYAVARAGKSWEKMPDDVDQHTDLTPIFDAIVKEIPAPNVSIDGAFQMLITSLQYDNFLGKYAIGKIARGVVKSGSQVALLRQKDSATQSEAKQPSNSPEFPTVIWGSEKGTEAKFEIFSEIPDLPITASMAIILKNNQVLLTKNPRGWDIPGGKLENDETPLETLNREVMEEVSARIKNPCLLGGWRAKKVKQTDENAKFPDEALQLLYLVDLESEEEFQASHDATERKWFDLDEVNFATDARLDLKHILTVAEKLHDQKIDAEVIPVKIDKIFTYQGLSKAEVKEAIAGDIVAITGVANAKIGETLADANQPEPLPTLQIEPPTISVYLGPNTSPFKGRESRFNTSRQIAERLNRELETNVALKVEPSGIGFTISGRGELHLSVLMESLRREGYEFEVGRPQVVLKEENGQKLEPVEEVFVEVAPEFAGAVAQEFGARHAELLNQETTVQNTARFDYRITTRGLIGLRNILLTATKGTLIMSSLPAGYQPLGAKFSNLRNGALIASETGTTTPYALQTAEARGELFVGAGVPVYAGQIIGLNNRHEDLEINVCKAKNLTNMRSKSSDGTVQLTPFTDLSLEQSLDFIGDDELLEITPQNMRLRKSFLDANERKKHAKQN